MDEVLSRKPEDAPRLFPSRPNNAFSVRTLLGKKKPSKAISFSGSCWRNILLDYRWGKRRENAKLKAGPSTSGEPRKSYVRSRPPKKTDFRLNISGNLINIKVMDECLGILVIEV